MSFQSLVSRRLASAAGRSLSIGSRTSIRQKATAAAAESSTAANVSKSESVPIGKALLATAAGIITVSGAAAAVEYGTAASVPSFDPNGQRFSQEFFSGRFCKMLLACDPRLLLYSEDQVRRCQDMIKDYQTYVGQDMDRALWEAKRISEAALHPDTGNVIPRPFRMSGYVPFNGPVAVAMVASTSTVPLLFWSWVNQSQNALVNYFNRNASSPMTNETLAISYGTALSQASLHVSVVLLMAFILFRFRCCRWLGTSCGIWFGHCHSKEVSCRSSKEANALCGLSKCCGS